MKIPIRRSGPSGRSPVRRTVLRAVLAVLLPLSAATVVVASTASPAQADDYYNSITEASSENRNWMSRVPDDTKLSALSVPGTHDSLSLCGFSGGGGCESFSTSVTKTQEDHGYSGRTLTTQYEAGIRAIDIRVRVDKGDAGMSFTIHHGVYYQHANFTDVLTRTRDFLRANPSETVLLSLKAECSGSGAFTCYDADGYDTTDWRLKVFRSYLEGRAYTGDGDEYEPATAWRELFWADSVTGDAKAAVPTLDQVRGKIVLLGFRGPRGGVYNGYGVLPTFESDTSYTEYVQDSFEVPNLWDIAPKWEKVRTHLRKTNGVWDANRGEQTAHPHRPDAIYVNFASGTGDTVHPLMVAGGQPGVTGVNNFLLQCLRERNSRCPEFYPDRGDNFGGRQTMDRTGVLMMDFPGGGLIDEIIARNPEGGNGPGELEPGTLPPYRGGTPRPQLDGELLENTDFADTTKPWWVNAGMTERLSGGAFCVTAPARTNPWDVIVGHNSIYLPGGNSYTLRFRARASVSRQVVVQLAPFDNPTNVTYLTKYPTLGDGWKTFEYTFDTTFAQPYVLAQLQFRLGGASGSYEFCMDDVSLAGREYVYTANRGPLLKVNQHGYAPTGPKRATVLTNATSALGWTLRRVGGGTVATGTTRPAGFDGSAGTGVHTIDFSQVTATGRFELAIGNEVSHPFDIRSDLYASLRTDSMRFFYSNRSGIAIDGGIAGAEYARPAGHVAASPNGGDTNVACQTPKSYVDNWTCDYRLDVTGGWYDAGDHGKYVVNGGIATYQLLSAWERAVAAGTQAQLGDSTLAVPERGNGVPDILDEARWNLEFMLKMQVPAGEPLAGMVHHKVHDESWSGPPMLPHQASKKRELHRPSTAATLNLAAVAAQGARVYQQFDAAFANRLRVAAGRAYTAARNNPTLYAPHADRVGGGPYNDDDVTDEFYWAAAQLYLTTKTSTYLDDLRLSRHHAAGVAFSQNGFYWGSVAALAQLDLARFGTDLSERSQIRSWVTTAADRLISFQRAERFGQTYTPASGRYAWGSNASILNNQVVLATAYDLTKSRVYADAVLEGFDYLLGRNALGQSYVTGYGTNDAKNQHSRWYAKSLDARLPHPPVGSVAGGPNSGLDDPLAASWLHGCAPQLCYVDNLEAWSVNEITINWNSALAWVSAFAADVARG
ncbi:phosphatidylinositol-specific phospholipase C domain-containing protein [Micromonospora sp. CA-263727]|uniref:phosphatidylinositol-specific phospholipase C domain-containing protein n=1 Tax=Micromonospora sp. CA-263727 TaxID=3239967 RepID=UPI003D8ACA6E